MMQRSLLSLATLALLIAQSATAKCIDRPNFLAEVTVVTCVGVTFEASQSDYTGFGGSDPMYKSGDKISGTYLVVTALKVESRWNAGVARHSDYSDWHKNETRQLFVARPFYEVCPKKMPSSLTVLTKIPCCDEIPIAGLCLVPDSILIADIVRSKN